MAEVKVPPAAELLMAFANTVDEDTGDDELTSRAELTRWLFERGLLARRTPSTDADVKLARDLRDGLREAIAVDRGSAGNAVFEQAAAQLPLRVCCQTDPPTLEPVDTGVRGALARVMVAANSAVAGDLWGRIKICPADNCRVAFYDTSKNRSKQWCDMGVCGNRAKTRSYRARQRAAH